MKVVFNKNMPYFGNRYNKIQVFSYDDSASKDRRKFIRQHIEEDCPFIRDEEKEFKRLMLEGWRASLSNPRLPEFKMFEPTCIRGGGFNPELFEFLHGKRGIKQVIALAPDETKEASIMSAAAKAGVQYVPTKVVCPQSAMLSQEIPFKDNDELVDSFLQRAKNSGATEEQLEKINTDMRESLNEVNRNYIENELIPFILAMQKGHLFIGCQFGTNRTDTAISLNSWFNPQCINNFICLGNRMDLVAFNNLYNKLTFKDKYALGFTKDFDESFKKAMETELAF